METLVNYIPKLLAATAIVVIGLLIASFLRGVIATGADRMGVSYADRLALGCYYVLAFLTFFAAFEQLNIQFKLLEQVVLITFGGLALGSGLALGLGGRDVVGGSHRDRNERPRTGRSSYRSQYQDAQRSRSLSTPLKPGFSRGRASSRIAIRSPASALDAGLLRVHQQSLILVFIEFPAMLASTSYSERER
jgi:hypothetical protein